MKKMNMFLCTALVVTMAFVTIFAGPVYALPSLQLGDGDSGTWTYNLGTQTWVVEESLFSLNAYANALSEDGGNGDYAWAAAEDPLVAYLVVSAIPKMDYDGILDLFNVTVSNDGGDLAVLSSYFGTPSISDPDPLHGIYPTYLEICQFQFDGSTGPISDQQPGQGGSGIGYTETFGISIGLLADGVTGIHFDLYTDGAFAPFSHDAETAPVPEPATMLLFGVGLIGIAGLGRRKLIKK